MQIELVNNLGISFNEALSKIGKSVLKNDDIITENDSKAKPFVKWVGGKRSLIKELSTRTPQTYKRYYEPFVGGGALLFALTPSSATISDINLDLVITYAVIKNNPQELIKLLTKHKVNHCEEYYYKIRKQFINDNDVEVAGRFIYLNKTCYNGLYRVNNKGEFNVPMGKYKNPAIVDETNIIACSKLLQNVDIQHQDFSEISPNKGDFVYIDPPYHPINNKSFTKYTKLDFTEIDQIKLYQKCKELNDKGVYFMLSNSNIQFIKHMYKDFYIEIIEVPRTINCKANGRKNAEEVLIRNYE
ncbi:DNA adenine methylase [Candidatus Tisiphia endosymbiont of Ditula angustiorana]|uniref:DNA adenine methylase n=1 Tax=Candidatus Tisiphia endosymbiont of Ditula angustiorana TaxID=3066272 RepID=UPI00312C6E13